MTNRIKQGNNDLLLFSYILPPSDHICLVSRRQPRAQDRMGRTMISHAFRAEKRSAQASAHPLSQAQGGLFSVLTMCSLCLFVAGVLSEMHEVPTFAPCKAFLFEMFAFFRRLKITLDSEQPMLKEKRIIPSV